MRIAVTATGRDLEAKVDARFGRCPYFLLVETDDLSFEALENPNVILGGGAGVQSAQLMAEKDIKHVLTGNCGPNAYQTLSAAGIGVIVGCSGTVADVVERFNAGRLNAAGEPNVARKFGVAGTPSSPPDRPAGVQQPPMTRRGMGIGRGMGRRGGGQGRGQGMARRAGERPGQGMGAVCPQEPAAIPQQPAQNLTKGNELAMLQQQAEAVSRQLRQIQERIEQLEREG